MAKHMAAGSSGAAENERDVLSSPDLEPMRPRGRRFRSTEPAAGEDELTRVLGHEITQRVTPQESNDETTRLVRGSSPVVSDTPAWADSVPAAKEWDQDYEDEVARQAMDSLKSVPTPAQSDDGNQDGFGGWERQDGRTINDEGVDISEMMGPEQRRRRRKSKRARTRDILSNLLIVAGVVLLAVAGFIYFTNTRNYQKIDEENERVAEYAHLSNDSSDAPQVDWEALRAVNPDVVGWLEVPGTVVNYPVFQTTNNDFYLDHGPDRGNSIGGSVFLDFESTTPGMVDQQSIVYGHHMRNGSQFKQIADMDNQQVFDGVGTMWYVTEQGSFKLTPLFLFYTSPTDTVVRQFRFADLEQFRSYLRGYLERAVTKRDNAEEAINSVTKVLTLSTCNYYDGYGRSLLVCAVKAEVPGTEEYEAAHAAPVEPPVEEQQPMEEEFVE